MASIMTGYLFMRLWTTLLEEDISWKSLLKLVQIVVLQWTRKIFDVVEMVELQSQLYFYILRTCQKDDIMAESQNLLVIRESVQALQFGTRQVYRFQICETGNESFKTMLKGEQLIYKNVPTNLWQEKKWALCSMDRLYQL